jgi:hypothetical protein
MSSIKKSDYWQAHGRFWCKVCKVFIANNKAVPISMCTPLHLSPTFPTCTSINTDPPVPCLCDAVLVQSMTGHETGSKHQYNVKRHLREMNMKGRGDRDEQKELRDIERAAARAFRADVANSYAAPDPAQSQPTHTHNAPQVHCSVGLTAPATATATAQCPVRFYAR